MSHADLQHFTIQVGETAQRWRIRLTSAGRAYAIPTGTTFVLNMVSVDAAEGDDPKIDEGECTFTDDDDSVYYQPEDEDVDAAGRYRAQLFGTTAGEKAMRPMEFEVTIRANVVPETET